MSGTTFRIGQSAAWVGSVEFDPTNNDNENGNENNGSASPMALHFVVDNSASMGRMTKEVIEIFSAFVDTAASQPCSLTLFSTEATMLSARITSSSDMVALSTLIPRQGRTNIPSGIRAAVKTIALTEENMTLAGKNTGQKTHHVIVLLTDGQHNSGNHPHHEIPKIGEECRERTPNVQLSVVVVGITTNSSTSMGMQLKTHLETVPLDSESVENIYFAMTRNEMRRVTKKLVEGLVSISSGLVRNVSHPEAILLSEIGEPPVEALTIRMSPTERTISVLIHSKDPPDYLVVDGIKMHLAVSDKIVDYDVMVEVFREHIDKLRIKLVASTDTVTIRSAVSQLNSLINGVEKDMLLQQKGAGKELQLAKVRGADRLAQHRQITRTVHLAKELRNELAEVANFVANSSAEQAAFLCGRKSKYASKAIRRAAARSNGGDMILDSQQELDRIYHELKNKSFAENLRCQMRKDSIAHLARLSKKQYQQLEDRVSAGHLHLLHRIMTIKSEKGSLDPGKTGDPGKTWNEDVLASACNEVREFVDSGILAGYVNDLFFGARVSYLSLSSPWEHIAEWRDLCEETANFASQWEMLLYAGSVAYPIVVERSAGAQMNPFQLQVTKVHTTLIDSASLCCANHSGIDTYGPEGGVPIKDALVLVDPSNPNASTQIVSSKLLGETFTSVVVSRDLHMYTGASMKIAILAHSLFRCLQSEHVHYTSRSDAVAEIRRAYLGSAYQCASCGFGPVDHGGCSDLFSHHGEVDYGGGVASNACPACGWFAEDLQDWRPWDGNVPETLIAEKLEVETTSEDTASSIKPSHRKIDLVLRILYSFRKLFFHRLQNNPIRTQYNGLARKLVDWDLSITTQDGVDGLVQILIAVMACDETIIAHDKAIQGAFAPPVMLAIVNEACARAARKKFRMVSGGEEAKAKDLAAKHVTSMLSISECSAPRTTATLLEPEPDRSVVEMNCSRDFSIDNCKNEMKWVKKIAKRWCTVFSFAKALRASLIRRGGGWDRLERDMETSLDDYDDVVTDLQNTALPAALEMCGIADSRPYLVERSLATIAAQAFLYNKGSSRRNLPDVLCGETLPGMARDMRMCIYSKRVAAKMAQWSNEGEQLAFQKARASDIGQYVGMVQASAHVHGFTAEMFWGLWDAAICDGHGGAKVRAFLDTANHGFRMKHAPGNGPLTSRRKKNR